MKLLVLLLLPCLSLSELVPGFGKCKDFFLNDDPPQFTPQQGTPATVPPQWVTSVKEICQCLRDNNNQKIYLYATLYNTALKIPIYSAYEFRSSIDVGRCDVWYIEPQLDGGAEACMAPKGKIQNIGDNQAVNDDYEGSNKRGCDDYEGSNKRGCDDYEDQGSNKPKKYDRGHLYPVQHTDNPLSMLATSTLTNAAPQDSSFNRGKWSKHEKAVIEDLKSCSSVAYVVTGVVPDDATISNLKDGVTVSKYYWSATCCETNGVFTGKAYFGPDNNNVVNDNLSITALQTQLATDYRVNNVVIFPTIPIPTGSKRPLTHGCN